MTSETTVPTMSFRWFRRYQVSGSGNITWGEPVLQQMHYVSSRQEWRDVPTIKEPLTPGAPFTALAATARTKGIS